MSTTPSEVHFSTMMMQTACEREETSFSLVEPVARCRGGDMNTSELHAAGSALRSCFEKYMHTHIYTYVNEQWQACMTGVGGM